MLEEFERFAIRVIFLEQPPTDDPHTALLVQIQGTVAEYERTKLAERYRRGKLYRARQGEVFWTSIPYSYRRVARRGGVPAITSTSVERWDRSALRASARYASQRVASEPLKAVYSPGKAGRLRKKTGESRTNQLEFSV